MDKLITVHIADDHQILIDGVKAVLNIESGIEVIGYSLNGNEVIEWYTENESDVLILDINMPLYSSLKQLFLGMCQKKSADICFQFIHDLFSRC